MQSLHQTTVVLTPVLVLIVTWHAPGGFRIWMRVGWHAPGVLSVDNGFCLTYSLTMSHNVMLQIYGEGRIENRVAPPQSRYLFKPHYGSSHWWALKQCERLSSDLRVLDFGSGGGGMGRALRERGFTDLCGVEIDPSAREHCRDVYHCLGADIADIPQPHFDLILLLDVLEHLTDPGSLLEKLTDRLNPGGRILISVPNIAHWSIRLLLLFGEFNYTDRGLLDRTHFSHFTRRRLLDMIAKVDGLRVDHIDGSISPAEFVLPEWFVNTPFFTLFSMIRKFGVKLCPGLASYQHLAVISKQGF